MIRSSTGNLLEADAEALVNTVNCVGVMGKGIALQFKQAFPENFKAYAQAVKRGEVELGRMFVFPTGALENPRYIVNFPTKQHWRDKSGIEDIRTGLATLVPELRRLGIRSIAIPPLGCGNGGLSWRDVRPLIEAAFTCAEEIDVLLFDSYTELDEFSFDRTVVPLRLAQHEGEKLISRSQAKQASHRFERFKCVELDFAGISEIGQAFADELFRVFAAAHPQIRITPINAEPAVAQMIQRAVVARSSQSAPGAGGKPA